MKILVAGDLVPTENNKDRFARKDFINCFDKEFSNIWNKAEFRIFNLECPLGENDNKIDKNGAILQANSNTINGIKSLKPNLILLSNNHILDHGQEGLENTIRLLDENDIPYTGIIENSEKEYEVYYVEDGNIRIGIYNVCENEFSVATSSTKGANPLNEIKNYFEIKKSKEKCDYLIVVFHGGKEFYRYPSPNCQRICRMFVDSGADLVITQHSHCIGAEEDYRNGKILYGQGNFIFDNGVNDEFWNSALLVELDISKQEMKVKYIPIEKHDGLIKISENPNILDEFWDRKEKIKSPKFINAQYEKFANEYINQYLAIVSKPTILKRIMNKISKKRYYLKRYNKKNLLKILNIIECEAHRELFIKGLKDVIGEKNV